jgi:hypothetical protein
MNRRECITLLGGAAATMTAGPLTLAKWETVSGQFGGYLRDVADMISDIFAKLYEDLRFDGDFAEKIISPTVASVIQAVEGLFHLLIDGRPLGISNDLPERLGNSRPAEQRYEGALPHRGTPGPQATAGAFCRVEATSARGGPGPGASQPEMS